MNILSTRPLSDTTLDRAQQKNISVDTIPFIRTEHLLPRTAIQKIKSYSSLPATVIFTSVNAVNAVVSQLTNVPQWNIYCIAEATKNAVTHFFGPQSIAASAPNATLLLNSLLSHTSYLIPHTFHPPISYHLSPIVFFCGNKRLNTIPATLTQHNIALDEIVVYQTIATPLHVEKDYDGILFLSPSAVKSFFSKNTIPLNTILFAIGETTAACIRQYTSNEIVISTEPSEAALLDAVLGTAI